MQWHLLSDEALHENLLSCYGDHRRGMVEILQYLGEVDRRGIYAAMGYKSLFAYCLKELKMSENEAGPRVAVTRLAKEYPWVLEALGGGDVHLTGLFRLSGYMQPTNCLDLLREARGKTVREIDERLAVHFPRPDVPEVLRALPLQKKSATPTASADPPKKSSAAERTIPMFDAQTLGAAAPSATSAASATSATSTSSTASVASAAPATSIPSAPSAASIQSSVNSTESSSVSASRMPSTLSALESTTPQAMTQESSGRAPRRRAEKLTPLSETRHALQITISTDLRDKLERARSLMSHRNRSGRYETIVDAAVDLLLAKLERERLGKIKRNSTRKAPKKVSVQPASAPAASTVSNTAASATASATTNTPSSSATLPIPSSRTSSSSLPSRSVAADGQNQPNAKPRSIPRSARREVFERDGEQCSFVSKAGVRCDARAFLELDHVHPKALGGVEAASNLRVLCVTHNRLAAERVFGRDHIRRKIRESRNRRPARQRG